jgi:ABC-type phosphate transport system permease subunit
MSYLGYFWLIFLTYVIVWVLIKILDFYGIGSNVYGIYLGFLVFVILSIMILPHTYSVLD